MTYFISDANGPIDLAWSLENDARRDAEILAVSHGKEVGCLFPDDHDPRHPADMRFRVSMHDRIGRTSDAWEELTEAEMAARYEAGATGALLSSTFDFWWEFPNG